MSGARTCVSIVKELLDLSRKQKRPLAAAGRTKDWGVLFLVVRLGEAFAFSTGIEPAFSWNQKGGRQEPEVSQWQQLLLSSFKIFGLSRSLGHYLRLVPARHSDRIGEIAQWARSGGGPRWEFGACQSVGIQIDWLAPRGNSAVKWAVPIINPAGLTDVLTAQGDKMRKSAQGTAE